MLAARRHCSVLVFTLLVVACSMAQDASQRPQAPLFPEPDKVPLAVVSTVSVSSLPSRDLALALPLLCGREGTVVVRFFSMSPTQPPEGGEPLAISAEGKVVARFGTEKIADVQQPRPLGIFLADGDLYMLTSGQVPEGHQTKLRTPKGEVVQYPAVKRQYYVARFKGDGTYVAATALDIPFKPIQLGVFYNGDFLIAGEDPATGNPRLAIVSSRGAFLRSVELKGDIHAPTESEVRHGSQDKNALPRFAPGETYGESLMDVVYTSEIAGRGSDLLLFRPFGSTVFSISAGGEAHAVRLNVPGELQIHEVKPAQNSWFVEFTRHESGNKVGELVTYEFDSVTGDVLKQYIFPNDLGFGLACADGARFTVIMADSTSDGVKLVTLAPGVPNN